MQLILTQVKQSYGFVCFEITDQFYNMQLLLYQFQ